MAAGHVKKYTDFARGLFQILQQQPPIDRPRIDELGCVYSVIYTTPAGAGYGARGFYNDHYQHFVHHFNILLCLYRGSVSVATFPSLNDPRSPAALRQTRKNATKNKDTGE